MAQKLSAGLLREALLKNSASIFEQGISGDPVLSKLWSIRLPEEDNVNAPTTLPIPVKPKHQIYEEIAKTNPSSHGAGLKLKQYFTYFKSIVYFFRVGIQNVWSNQNQVRLLKAKYFIEDVDSRSHNRIHRKFKNGRDLVNVLHSVQDSSKVEQETLKTDEPTTVFNINRRELQLVLRTEHDFYKLPLFAVILLIFAETTPIICYLIPEVVPSTCVFPNVLKKKMNNSTTALEKLTELRKERYSKSYAEGSVPNQSVHLLKEDELLLLGKGLGLTSRYIPVGLYPTSLLKARLERRFKEIQVDDNLLILNGEFWKLSKIELLRSCIDRGLLNLNKDDLEHITFNELQMRLFFHLSLAKKKENINNIGIIGVNHLGIDNIAYFHNLNHEDALKIHNWWSHKHKEELVHLEFGTK